MNSSARTAMAVALAAALVAPLAGCSQGNGLPGDFNVTGPKISDTLVGNNVWYQPDDDVWAVTAEAELKMLRVGGIAYDNDLAPTFLMEIWIDKIRAMGAEPLLQVSRYDTPEAAAEVVRHFTEDVDPPVKYWSIGNEPNCRTATLEEATEVAAYVKPISTAMREVEPNIVIYAPDECNYYADYYEALFSGNGDETDISGKIPGTNTYYVDGLSWHHYIGYPPEETPIEALTSDGVADYARDMAAVKALVDAANEANDRTGDDALAWGLGEFNARGGARVCTFENGQMIALTYGEIMRYEGEYGLLWSLKQNSGVCLGEDHGFLDGKNKPRPSFHHMRLVSEYFTGWFVDLETTTSDVRGFGSADGEKDRVTVLLVNDSPTAAYTCSVDMTGAAAPAGPCVLTSDLGAPISVDVEVEPATTYVLVFDLDGNLTSTVTYSADMDAPSDR